MAPCSSAIQRRGVEYLQAPDTGIGDNNMKRTLICVALSLSLAALPMASEAHGWGGRGGFHGNGVGRVIGLPFVLGAAAIGAVATIAAAPFYAASYAPPPAPVYYNNAPAYGYVQAPVQYGYGPAPVYRAAPQMCTYYPNGATYCR
jgi:hypothetical protein